MLQDMGSSTAFCSSRMPSQVSRASHLHTVDSAKAGEGHAQDNLVHLRREVADVHCGDLFGVVLTVPLAGIFWVVLGRGGCRSSCKRTGREDSTCP